MRKLKIAVVAIAAIALLRLIGLVGGYSFLRSQPVSTPRDETSAVYSPAHASVGEALRHFLSYRPELPQPIAFNHKVHTEIAELGCVECHFTAPRGPVASIPDIRTCLDCHDTPVTGNPEIDKIAAYQQKGQDIPWQRVYGWTDEAHLRFNHAPHIRAEVECATCHGDVAQMTVARRVVEHTMGFCVGCHKEKQVSNDCVTCHY